MLHVQRYARAAVRSLLNPIRQAVLLTCLAPDWAAAPRHLSALAAYASILIGALTARMALVDGHLGTSALVAATGAFLAYAGPTALLVAMLTVTGYYMIRWPCIARSASPFALLGMAFAVSTVDQAMVIAAHTWCADPEVLATALGVRELVTTCLGLYVVIDYVRPRPPRKRRPARKSVGSNFEPSTTPAN